MNMISRIREIIKAIELKHLGYFLFLSFIALNFILCFGHCQVVSLIGFKLNGFSLASYIQNLAFLAPSLLIMLFITLFFCVYIFIASRFSDDPKTSLMYAGISLFPVALLCLWISNEKFLSVFLAVTTIALSCFLFFKSLRGQEKGYFRLNEKAVLTAFTASYIIFFFFVAWQKYNALSSFNPKDFANYNQTFWNTIHGRIFMNSIYGSNFACHNSPFYFLLVPFYFIAPHPLTLMFAKTIFLALAIIPFYLIAKSELEDASAVPITLAFMAFPFLISLNISAPHEIAYAPFFLLFTYYFFSKKRFSLFLLFLILCLTIKEHLALTAVMFGILAAIKKRSAKWILVPILLGLFWLGFSLWLIHHFQLKYNTDPESTWVINYFKDKILNYNGDILKATQETFKYANMLNPSSQEQIMLLFLPLGILPAFLSSVSILGLPEFLINLTLNHPAMFAIIWHYNVAFSCFLLVASIEGIKKISRFRGFKILKINYRTAVMLLCISLFANTLINSYQWLGWLQTKKNKDYIKSAKKAFSLIPMDAEVTVPRELAVWVSSRPQFYLLDKRKLAEYIIIDTTLLSLVPKENKEGIKRNYKEIFSEGEIKVFKKLE